MSNLEPPIWRALYQKSSNIEISEENYVFSMFYSDTGCPMKHDSW